MTWTEAKERCENKDAHLAHIANKNTNDGLIALIPKGPKNIQKGVWIGYSDSAQDWHNIIDFLVRRFLASFKSI